MTPDALPRDEQSFKRLEFIMPYPIFRSMLLLGCLAGISIAQEQEPQQPPQPQQVSKDNPAGISIPDSPGAIERLEKAKEKEDQHQWKTAAEYYQEVLARYARRVVPANINRDAGVFQYVGVARVVQERIAKWPDDGLNAYRTAYGQTAADLLAATRRDDVAALENIFWTYFITDAGKAAGMRLMDAHTEAGRFTAAAWIGQRLLSLHPLLGGDRAMIAYRTALVEYWSGDITAAGALIDELKQKHPNDTGTIGGKDVVLADALAEALKSPPPQPTTRASDADNWPTFGGPGGAGAISPSAVKPGLSSISIRLAAPSLNGLPEAGRRMFVQADAQDLSTGQGLGIMPAVEGGALFFQDGRHVYAVSADSGLPLPGWSQTYPGERGGRYSMDIFGRARGEQLTVTVTPKQVLAIMGQLDRQQTIVAMTAQPSVRLVCLDRNTGKELWTRSPAELPESVAALRTADFNGTPLVVPDNDSVLVVARGGKGNQFEDGYVVCLSLSGGQYKWSTYVGSASHMFDMGDNGVEQLGTSEMCLAEGRVFVLTNLGTVAALDPYDGRMIWLSAYPRDVTDNPEQMQMVFRNRMANGGRAGTNKPWANNPVIVANGKVFVLPTDGRHLLVYDAGTGAEANRILLSDYDNADVLLGVRPRMAILSTEKGCYCIDWRAYTHDDAEHAIIWARKDVAADTVAGEENTIFGRGFVTSDSVFLPTRHRLYQLGWFKGGKVMSMYPSRGQWSGDEEPGNVLATSQGVIIAGSTRVEVYRDLTLVRRQFEERIAASPNDPQPRIDYASALFASGQLDAAVAKLDEAIEMIGGQSAMRPGKGRDLVFTTALSFAERAAKDPANETGSVTEKLYDRAAAAADSPLDQAVYRLSRARHLHDRKDYAGEVKLCQEVLSDDAMRAVSVNDNTTAGAEAEAAVNGAMLADRTAYAPIEQAAAAAVKAASAADDPSQMLAVARVYPNSRAAAEARQAAAKLLEAAKRYDEAIATLREMYAGSLDPAVRTNLLVSVANDYLTMPGGVGPAIDRLAMATAKDQVQDRMPQALILPDGTRIENATFTAAIGTLREMQEKEDVARLPDFHIPVQVHAKDKAFTRTEGSLVIPDVTALVRPLRDFPRNDRVVAWSATAGLSIYPVGESTPVTTMPASALPESPGGCAWIDPAKLVLWSGSRVMLLGDGAGAGPKWQTPLPSGPALSTTVADSRGAIDDEQVAMDQAAGNAGAAGPNGIVIDGGFGGGGRIIVRNGRQFIINGGQIRFIAQGNIGIAGQPAAAPAPAGAAAVGLGPQITMFRPAGDRIVLSTSLGTLMGLKVNDGGIAWQMRLAEGPLTQVLANGRFTVARIDDPAGAQLIVLDTPTGRVIGRRRFGPDGTGNQLMNVALSEEATLVWTTLAKLLSKDLYEPWRNPPVDLSTRPTGEAMNFAGLNQPDQLLVRAGRVVALYDGGKFVRVQDLSNRRIDPVTPAANPLATGADTTAGSASVALRLVGPRLFITNGRNLWQYNLASADDHYKTLLFDLDYPPRIRELFLGQDHAILLNEPVDRGPLGSSFVQLLIHRRGPIGPGNAREASNLDYYPQITDKSGIFAWQAVDGGMYYLSGDHQLHFLQARK